MLPKFKLIVAAGRDFNDYDLLTRVLYSLVDVELEGYQLEIISPISSGPDDPVYRFVEEHGLPHYIFINVDEVGDTPNGMLAFNNGTNPNIDLLLQQMMQQDKPVYIVNY